MAKQKTKSEYLFEETKELKDMPAILKNFQILLIEDKMLLQRLAK